MIIIIATIIVIHIYIYMYKASILVQIIPYTAPSQIRSPFRAGLISARTTYHRARSYIHIFIVLPCYRINSSLRAVLLRKKPVSQPACNGV